MQSGEVGPGLGEGNGERPELGPPETNPHMRLPGRCQSPRGSCGQRKDIGPGAPRSAPVAPPQVKSLAPTDEESLSVGAQGCQRNLSSGLGRGAAPGESAQSTRSDHSGLRNEAEQPNDLRGERTPQRPPAGDASLGDAVRHEPAAASDQMSDTGSSDDSSMRSDELGEPTTPLSGAVRSSPGGEELATEAKGGRSQVMRSPLHDAPPEQRDVIPHASIEPMETTERDAEGRE